MATVKHGDRLEIIQRRRKFLRVRTKSGVEGWTDERQLLGESDMAELKDLAARAAKLPSQGVATTYRDLNVHTQPASGSPSFLRIKDGEKFDVLSEVVAPRTDVPRKPLIPPAEKKKPQSTKKPKKEPKVPPPPVPAPPGPPPNWLELSQDRPRRGRGAGRGPRGEADPDGLVEPGADIVGAGRLGVDAIRLDGDSRRSRAVRGGHRIVSYLPLGYIEDGDQKKPIWLWTTMRGRQPFDFDSFRVFVWSLRRHRYETAYIDRSVRGYWPVLLNQRGFRGWQGRRRKVPRLFGMCREG